MGGGGVMAKTCHFWVTIASAELYPAQLFRLIQQLITPWGESENVSELAFNCDIFQWFFADKIFQIRSKLDTNLISSQALGHLLNV